MRNEAVPAAAPAETMTATIDVEGADDAGFPAPAEDAVDEGRITAAEVPPLSAAIYQHQDGEGSRVLFNHASGRYRRIQRWQLEARSLAEGASSIALRASSTLEAGGELILFNQERFSGKYQRFPVQPGQSLRQNLSFFMNDELNSALLLLRSRGETRTPIGSLGFGPQITNSLMNADPQRRLAPAGRPVFTWDMWPAEDDTPAPLRDRQLVLIKVPFEVDSPGANHSAELLAWIHPFLRPVDGVNRFGAGLVHLRLNVSGWAAGRVAEELRSLLIPQARQALAAMVQAAVTRATFAADGTMLPPIRSVYLLPGDGQSLAGQTEDDVTLVLAR